MRWLLPPVLWAFPALDFDEALGFTVVGDCFGELAIYDHAGLDPMNCCGLGIDFTKSTNPYSPRVASNAKPAPFNSVIEPDQILISHFAQDDLGLDSGIWRTDRLTGI
ncbi:hypothetical protein B0H17DRAFT_1193854 [Mycena rosella]|uniref:Uncharacterized protein n=1 Tax=Mycena rosella TaxID=1033263 RepID=A0AAD7GRV3_MYCRO|nr:hypothetical protein B0H17DRAFT_1193854 [Mycena rosella]